MTGKQARRRQLLRTIGLHFSGMDVLKALGLYLVAVMCCLLLRSFDMHNDTSYVAMIFLLDVFLTAYWTDGYLLGIIMAVVGMFSVDIIFTYPFWHISFTLTGFPLTFLVMMTISILTATVTSRAKQTEQVRREADREKMYADLLRAVSHDIRTPLTGIVGATNVLLEQDGGLTQEQRQQLLRSTNEDAQWLIRMVENLLSITRISGEQTAISKEYEAAEEILAASVHKFEKRFKSNIRIAVEVPREVVLVPMDATLIQQVLLNLMENAVLHGENTTELRLSVEHIGDEACFTVNDNGLGIPRERLATLFDGSLSGEKGGGFDMKKNMGIGLSVCQTIVKAHGGRITAENRPEGGAQFRFYLPLKEEKEDEDQG